MKNSESKTNALIEDLDEDEIVKNLPIDEERRYMEKLMDDEEIIKVKKGVKTVVESKADLVFPSEDKLKRLLKIRKYNRFKKLFHSMHEGSLRKIVLLMVRMTVGVGILTLPCYVKVFGGLMGFVMLTLSALLSYFVYSFIIDVSNETGIYDYVLLTKRYCNKTIQKIFKFTYLIDVISMPILVTILSWNIVEYLMAFVGLAKDDWFIDKETFTYNEYHKEVFLIRLLYCVLIYLIMLPLLFRKDLKSLQIVGNIFLVFLLFLCGVILVEMPFFQSNLNKLGELQVQYFSKTPSFQWVESFFSMILSYYCQPYYFAIRNELMHPTKKRLKKVVRFSMMSILTFFVLIGVICYLCLGDRFTPDLVILRKAYEGKPGWSEGVFQVSILLFFFVSILSMPLFNPPLRDYIMVEFKFEPTTKNYNIWSTLPYLISCIICLVYPTIIGVFNFFGVTVFNFNG